MNPYEGLAERIRGESIDLGRLVSKAVQVWNKSRNIPENQDIYLDSVAFNLQGFYSGLERIFETIARRVDQNVPSGETWHRELLNQMGREVAGVRPAVVSQQSIITLDEFRKFRHLIRNVYSFSLVPEKIDPLVSSVAAAWPQLRSELSAFADYLLVLSTPKNV